MRPEATGDRTTLMCSIPGTAMSAANRPRPLSSGGSSSRLTERPITASPAAALPPERPAPRSGCSGIRCSGTDWRERLPQPDLVDSGPSLQDADGQHQEPRRAESALQAVVVAERLLQRVQPPPCARPSIVGVGAIGLHREDQAGADRLRRREDRAGATDAMLAAEMGAGEAAIFAERVGQGASAAQPRPRK